MILRFVDIETFSSQDITKVGRKNYTQSDDFEILITGYSQIEINNVYDLRLIEYNDFEQEIIKNFKQVEDPRYLYLDFFNPNIIWVAHNAPFEIECFETALGIKLNLKNWLCTMVWSYSMGLPGSLESLSKILKLKNAKLDGKRLIKFFSTPNTPTKLRPWNRNTKENCPDKWKEYLEYNKFDVLSTAELVHRVLASFPMLPKEHLLWMLDQKINNKGVLLDMDLVKSAISYINASISTTKEKIEDITGIQNANSVKQLSDWLHGELNGVYYVENLQKDTVKKLLTEYQLSDKIKEVLSLRQSLGKSSLKKYYKMMDVAYESRVYGTLQMCGAFTTGRWAGREIQFQNLAKNKLGKDLDILREAYKCRTRPIIPESLASDLSQLLRTCIIPDHGKTLLVADYSAIEARVAAWEANQFNVLKIFELGGDIYKATAANMYGKKYDDITKEERGYGKVAVLACGYGGGEKAVMQFAPEFDVETRQEIVTLYRESNPNIVSYWSRIEKACKKVLDTGDIVHVGHCKVFKRRGCLCIELPSGRCLIYPRAYVKETHRNGWLDRTIHYETKVNGRWDTTTTYGGKLFENIIQAEARDLLANALLILDDLGYEILFHVHDEIIVQMENPTDMDIAKMCRDMCILPPWAIGLPMKAEGYTTPYYMKEE